MPLKIVDIKVKGYERVVHATNETTKLDCIISIHNTKLGPALGGVRSWKYSSFENQRVFAKMDNKSKTRTISLTLVRHGQTEANHGGLIQVC